jgi:hypothetical protein
VILQQTLAMAVRHGPTRTDPGTRNRQLALPIGAAAASSSSPGADPLFACARFARYG